MYDICFFFLQKLLVIVMNITTQKKIMIDFLQNWWSCYHRIEII